jgi:hypothetical protein
MVHSSGRVRLQDEKVVRKTIIRLLSFRARGTTFITWTRRGKKRTPWDGMANVASRVT